MSSDYSIEPAVTNLRNYLRIRSVHPNVNYDECINFLKGQAKELGLPVQVFEPLPKKPVLVITWEGLEPTLPSILLNSHMDVVPVFEKSWTYPPFDAHLEDGIIYGRGIQDMKSVAIQYIETVRRLKSKGIKLKRTVHLSFVPDEEIGGSTGMKEFVKTQDFRNLNVGFALDEGIASPNDDFLIFNCERTIYHVTVICPGKSGHGSLLLPDNCAEKATFALSEISWSQWVLRAALPETFYVSLNVTRNFMNYQDKLRYVIDQFMDLRQESKKKLADNPELTIGDVTTYNLTMLSGGVQSNVIPEKLTATFDVRLALAFKPKEFEAMLQRFCSEAGDNVTYEFIQRDPFVEPTKLDGSNQYWLAFKNAADNLNLSLKRRTFPGGTDSRYLRELGIPAIGFSPMSHTVPGLHEHNESLKVDVFLRGIGIYETLVPAVANV